MAHGNYAAAEEDMNAAMDVAEKKDEVYYAFSKLLYELNLKPGYTMYKDWDMNKSLSLAGEAYKQNPLPLYTLQEGNTLYALKDYEKACEKYTLSLTGTNMRSANLFLYAAQCKRMAGADTLQILALQDSAVACFSKPYLKDAAPALLERSNTLLALGRYRDAILDLNEYEHLMGDELTAYFYYRREQDRNAMPHVPTSRRRYRPGHTHGTQRTVIFMPNGPWSITVSGNLRRHSLPQKRARN